jgi:hypothetical protein
MKVKCKVREITEKELDLEYPYYLYFQDELCQDELVKVYPKYQVIVKYDSFGFKIECNSNTFYEEYQIISNLTSEQHFDEVFEEALQQLVKIKAEL